MTQPNTKLVNLELNYELSEAEAKDLKTKELGVSNITRNLINQAFTGNYAQPGVGEKTAKQWRSIRRALDHAIEEDKVNFVIFSLSDFDAVYDEVYKCLFNPMLARYAPYFYDELDIVKRRSNDEETVTQDSMKINKPSELKAAN